MNSIKKIILSAFLLISLSSFVFADVLPLPGVLDYGAFYLLIGIVGLIVIGIIAGGVLLVYKVHKKTEENNNPSDVEKKVKKIFKMGVIGLAVILVILFIITTVGGPFFMPPTFNPSIALSNRLDAKLVIENSLNRVRLSETIITNQFLFQPDKLLLASSFGNQGYFDPHSLIFFKGWFKDNNKLIINQETGVDKVSSVIWTGLTPLRAKARVICRVTAFEAADEILLLSADYEVDANALIKYCGEIQPCCAVVFDTSTQ